MPPFYWIKENVYRPPCRQQRHPKNRHHYCSAVWTVPKLRRGYTVDNARAHFNLGFFLYEWGLGLKQDFPLAKRHYDLAVSGGSTREAELPVAIALFAMSVHEKCLKLYSSWTAWWMGTLYSERALSWIGKSKMNVVVNHVLTFESLALLLLTIFFLFLLRVQDKQTTQ
jgi:hypothetical protein